MPGEGARGASAIGFLQQILHGGDAVHRPSVINAGQIEQAAHKGIFRIDDGFQIPALQNRRQIFRLAVLEPVRFFPQPEGSVMILYVIA